MWIRRKEHLCVVQDLKAEISHLKMINKSISDELDRLRMYAEVVNDRYSELYNKSFKNIFIDKIMTYKPFSYLKRR